MKAGIHADPILILDFGSQYTQLIARRIRDIGVFCRILPCDCPATEIKALQPAGVILSGGPESALLEHTPRAPEIVFRLGKPILGICYGMQTMAKQLGGDVTHSGKHELGFARIAVRRQSPLLHGIVDEHASGQDYLDVWMSHGDEIAVLPTGFVVLAVSEGAGIAAMADLERGWYGVQFHPEVTHTLQGKRILQCFVRDVCACQALWNPANIADNAIAEIRAAVGMETVLLALSGGVDSSVVAALVHRAIGDRLVCVFVDNGLLRQGEAEQVMDTFATASNNALQLDVHHVDASEEFLGRLHGVTDPEEKRRIIGRTFIDVFEREARTLNSAQWLAQGTIYPDVIESAAHRFGKAHLIKSHHNVGGLPERMQLRLLEPIRELFKDEVRQVGLELGLPFDMVHRHPFPGPGLAVRVIGEVRTPYLQALRRADAIFLEELALASLYHKVSQAFAIFLPVKTVGIAGDSRRHEHVIALRAVETLDFMTASWAQLPHELLDRTASRIVNEIPNVSRVVYDITGKPPATIEWE